MLTNYILPDILQYVFNEYIDHHDCKINKFVKKFVFQKRKIH